MPKAPGKYTLMTTISGSTWRAIPEAKLQFYEATIRSLLQYGVNALMNSMEITFRTSLGLMTSTHTGSLEAKWPEFSRWIFAGCSFEINMRFNL